MTRLTNDPVVREIKLNKHFPFMYDNFVVSSQRELFLLLEEQNGIIDALKFDFLIYKYGYPNDEVGHPLMKFGLGFYGFYEVSNSPWVEETKLHNRSHPRHSDEFYKLERHFVVKFKDVTLEVIARDYRQIELTKGEFFSIINNEIDSIRNVM